MPREFKKEKHAQFPMNKGETEDVVHGFISICVLKRLLSVYTGMLSDCSFKV